jgi:hypothetical protein
MSCISETDVKRENKNSNLTQKVRRVSTGWVGVWPINVQASSVITSMPMRGNLIDDGSAQSQYRIIPCSLNLAAF